MSAEVNGPFLMMVLIAKRLYFVNKHKDFVQENIHVIVWNSLGGTDLKTNNLRISTLIYDCIIT